MGRIGHIYGRETSPSFPRRLFEVYSTTMFLRVVRVRSRYGYERSPETLPQYLRSRRLHRNKPAVEYVGDNDPIGWPPNIAFGSKRQRIMSTGTLEGPALMVPPTPDTCFIQRHPSKPNVFLR